MTSKTENIYQFLWPTKGHKCYLQKHIYYDFWILSWFLILSQKCGFVCLIVFDSSVNRSSTERQRVLPKDTWFLLFPWNSFLRFLGSGKWCKNQSYWKINMKNAIYIGGSKMSRTKIHSPGFCHEREMGINIKSSK